MLTIAVAIQFFQERPKEGRTVDWRLTRQLLKHFGGTSETITRLANGDVEYEFVDFQLPHGVRALVVAFRHLK